MDHLIIIKSSTIVDARLIVSNYLNHVYTKNQLVSQLNNINNHHKMNSISLNFTISTLKKKLVIILAYTS